MQPDSPVLFNTFHQQPRGVEPVESEFRRIATPLPVPDSTKLLDRAARVFPQVNCYQSPVVWDRADGFQVHDAYGNTWIDFTSTAVLTNTGHGHPAIRDAVMRHVRDDGLLAQFSFLSEIRVAVAEKLLQIAPDHVEKVYFWTTGSEAIESAIRLARQWAMRRDPECYHIFSFTGDYHGCTYAAHQLSGDTSAKPWVRHPDAAFHRLPFPYAPGKGLAVGEDHWQTWFDRSVERCGVDPARIAAVVIETLQGWGAVPFPAGYMRALRRWADDHEVLLVFDEIQSGFARTGRWFAHEHYDVRADLICIGKGVTSSLPLAAVLGPAEILDVLPPGEVTTTHAAHPLSCAAALANLEVIDREDLVGRAAKIGCTAEAELGRLKQRWPDHIADVCGLGLLRGIHFRNPNTGELDARLARDVTFAAVERGVMLFQVNRPTIKVCPPLVIPEAALVEGIQVIDEAIASVLKKWRSGSSTAGASSG